MLSVTKISSSGKAACIELLFISAVRFYTGNIIAVNNKKAMEFLFTTSLSIDEADAVYEIYFDKEQYVFSPAANEKELPSFSFKRENDEWHEQEQLSPELKTQAINALENYLLAQH